MKRSMTHKQPIALVAFSLLAVALTAVAVITYSISLTGNMVRDAYASDWTTEFLISHLQSNDNSWPLSWEDLEDEHVSRYPQPCPFTFAEIRDRVELNFNVDAAVIANAEHRVSFFRLKSGSGANYGGDPNVRIRDYLTNQTKTLDANSK